MGYSVSVSIRSSDLKARMVTFLQGAYRPWAAIVDDDEEPQFWGPKDELDYAHAKCQLGFDGLADGGAEREYVLAFLRWVALQVGRRKRQFRAGTLSGAAPYYVCNGTEAIPVLCSTDWPDLPMSFLPFRTDPYGLLVEEQPARDLAWYHIPEGTYERVSATLQGKSTEVVQEALVRSGIERARTILQFIRAEIARLDVLWASYAA